MKVSIIDYDCGNIVSLRNALEHLGAQVTVTDESADFQNSDKIILPGVGAFGYGMANLRKKNLIDKLSEAVIHKKIPVLGICLGAQLMLSTGEEGAGDKGLDWVAGDVKKIESTGKSNRVPHVGWNHTHFVKDSLFAKKGDDQIFYYTHSYFMDLHDTNHMIAKCDYAHGFTSIFQKDNMWGCQFHPEKSQKSGLEFLAHFLNM